MSTNASWRQAANLLADLLDANVDEVNRDEFRKVLGLGPVNKIVPFGKRSEPVLDTFIRVDRSIQPVYPDWVTVMHSELEPTGLVEYDLGAVDPWLHDGQKNGRFMEGNKLYEYLKEKKMLESCLSLRDGEEIQKKGIAVFRKFFQGKSVFFWKSVVQARNGYINVPSLYGGGDKVVVYWSCLDGNWYDVHLALRFAS